MAGIKKVVILKINDYNRDEIKAKVKDAIDRYFPLAGYFHNGDKILLKPNLLMPAKPQDAVTTHPVFVEAVGSIFKDAGFPVAIADSPGGFIDNQDMDYIYNECGYAEMAKRCGFRLLNPERSLMREDIPFCGWTDGSFKIINLPKLKTHELMVMTLAAKNLYGCVNGMHKSQLHLSYPRPVNFTRILLKINSLVRPALNILDGIVALEGEGPSKKGVPRKLGVVVIGDDPFYIDLAIGRLVGLRDKAHILVQAALKEGLIKEDGFEIISDFKAMPIVKDFRFPAPTMLSFVPDGFLLFLGRFLKFRPAVAAKKCSGCGACAEVCPKKTITITGSKAVINYKACISCLCCAEMCRCAAIDLKKTTLVRLLLFLHKLTKSIITGLVGFWRRKDAGNKIQK